ncbi:MAG: PilZ domain-containing protein [Candidatus Omnitrophica bacterium]|nr:PilZ domain-containing protein [Candidatus Omnitrophota bacterium]
MATKTFSPERRKYIRIPSQNILYLKKFSVRDLTVDKRIERKIEAITKNLSVGGVLFDSDIKYSLGSLLKIELNLPGWEKFKNEFYRFDKTSRSEPLIVLANVVRLEVIIPEKSYEIGVCFSAIDTGHRWALMKYINSKK